MGVEVWFREGFKDVSAYSELIQTCGMKSHQTKMPLIIQRDTVVMMDSDISRLEKKVQCLYSGLPLMCSNSGMEAAN